MNLLWSIRRKTGAREPLSEAEQQLLREFFDAAGASKFSNSPTNDSEVYFMLDAVRLQQARQKGLLPQEFTTFSADFFYSPAAYGGDYDRWEREYSWFLELLGDFQRV